MSYAIMGITGQVGGAAARELLRKGTHVRGVVRDLAKADAWRRQGVELAQADWEDGPALASALRGVDGAFVMVPPDFAPSSDFREARTLAGTLATALLEAGTPRVVILSSIGAHRDHGLGLITQLYILESALQKLSVPVAFVRPGWFMENSLWDIEPARKTGAFSSFLYPIDREVPMVATADIGRVIAELLQAHWQGKRILELEGPRRYSPNDLADAFSDALNRPVVPHVIAREKWETMFRERGTADPTPRIDMLDGFNSGWIEFEGAPANHVKGRTELASVITELVAKT